MLYRTSLIITSLHILPIFVSIILKHFDDTSLCSLLFLLLSSCHFFFIFRRILCLPIPLLLPPHLSPRSWTASTETDGPESIRLLLTGRSLPPHTHTPHTPTTLIQDREKHIESRGKEDSFDVMMNVCVQDTTKIRWRCIIQHHKYWIKKYILFKTFLYMFLFYLDFTTDRYAVLFPTIFLVCFVFQSWDFLPRLWLCASSSLCHTLLRKRTSTRPWCSAQSHFPLCYS